MKARKPGGTGKEITPYSPFLEDPGISEFGALNTQRVDTFNGITLTEVDFFVSQRKVSEVRVVEPLLEFSFHLLGHARGHLYDGVSSLGEVSVGPATSLVSFNPDVVCRIEVQGGRAFPRAERVSPTGDAGPTFGG